MTRQIYGAALGKMPATYAAATDLAFFYRRYKSIIFYVLLIYEVEFYAIHLAAEGTRIYWKTIFFRIGPNDTHLSFR